MIVFDLSCHDGHRFEGWFASTEDFSNQQARGLLTCPQCDSVHVAKAPMAPAVPTKGNRQKAPAVSAKPVTNMTMPPEVAQAMASLAQAQAKALRNSTWVGDKFAEKSRAIHYGEVNAESIHGQATLKEAQDLVDEGIAVAPLPFPVAPPDDLN